MSCVSCLFLSLGGSAMWTKVLLSTMAALLLMAPESFAQRDAGSKIRGEYNFYGNSAGSSMRSAREYSGHYRQYAQTAKPVNPEVARDASDAIGSYIAKAQRHFAWMRTQAQAGDDKASLTALDSIDKHLAAAAKSHHEMHDTCLKASVDGAASMKCCQEIDDHLAKAIAEHDALMKRLASEKK